jgi:hypothetical protein
MKCLKNMQVKRKYCQNKQIKNITLPKQRTHNEKKWEGTHLWCLKVWCSKFKALTCTSQERREVPY